MFILDGVGDRPASQLGGLTPLEAAHIPNLDRLAQEGNSGMVDPLFPGIPVGTHTGTALLMGLPVAQAVRLARGPIEAAGIGIGVRPGDLAIRCNFATLEEAGEELRILDRRAGRIDSGTAELASLLHGVDLGLGVLATLHPATQHRAVLHLTGPELSAEITDTDPGTRHVASGVLPCRPLDPNNRSATNTARAVNRFIRLAHQRLAHAERNLRRGQQGLPPANGIITRGAGRLEPLTSLVGHYGLKCAAVAGEATVLGLARLLGFTTIRDARFTALADTDIEGKIGAALQALREHDLVFVHLKAPDVTAHDRDPLQKKAVLERFDRALAPLLGQPMALAVTGDHSTDSNTGRHTGDPVPSLIRTGQMRSDPVVQYGERHAIAGGLQRLTATGFLTTLLDGMGCVPQFRLWDQRLLFPG